MTAKKFVFEADDGEKITLAMKPWDINEIGEWIEFARQRIIDRGAKAAEKLADPEMRREVLNNAFRKADELDFDEEKKNGNGPLYSTEALRFALTLSARKADPSVTDQTVAKCMHDMAMVETAFQEVMRGCRIGGESG